MSGAQAKGPDAGQMQIMDNGKWQSSRSKGATRSHCRAPGENHASALLWGRLLAGPQRRKRVGSAQGLRNPTWSEAKLDAGWGSGGMEPGWGRRRRMFPSPGAGCDSLRETKTGQSGQSRVAEPGRTWPGPAAGHAFGFLAWGPIVIASSRQTRRPGGAGGERGRRNRHKLLNNRKEKEGPRKAG